MVRELLSALGSRCCPLQGPRFCDRDHIGNRSHFNAAGLRDSYTITRDTGNDISVKTEFALITRSAVATKE